MRKIFAALLISLLLSVNALALDAVGIWLFDDDTEADVAKDRSEKGNHGKIFGAEWVEGKFGNALRFNGSAYVEVPISDSMKDFEQEITFMAWIRPTQWPDWMKVAGMGNWTDASPKPFQFMLGFADVPGDLKFYVGDTTVAAGAPVIELDIWQHVAGVSAAGQRGELYVNGELINQNPATPLLPTPEDISLYIGGAFRRGDRTNLFVGDIDEAALFNTALSADEVKLYMNGLKELVQPVAPAGKLAATWGDIKGR